MVTNGRTFRDPSDAAACALCNWGWAEGKRNCKSVCIFPYHRLLAFVGPLDGGSSYLYHHWDPILIWTATSKRIIPPSWKKPTAGLARLSFLSSCPAIVWLGSRSDRLIRRCESPIPSENSVCTCVWLWVCVCVCVCVSRLEMKPLSFRRGVWIASIHPKSWLLSRSSPPPHLYLERVSVFIWSFCNSPVMFSWAIVRQEMKAPVSSSHSRNLSLQRVTRAICWFPRIFYGNWFILLFASPHPSHVRSPPASLYFTYIQSTHLAVASSILFRSDCARRESQSSEQKRQIKSNFSSKSKKAKLNKKNPLKMVLNKIKVIDLNDIEARQWRLLSDPSPLVWPENNDK